MIDDPDNKKFNETLKRMLNTPPKPHKQGVKDSLTESTQKKPDGRPAKKDRPED